MDTKIIKHQAISKILGDLFKGTCQYVCYTLDRWGEPIEPDQEALAEFRSYLCKLSERLQRDILSVAAVDSVIEFTQRTGRNCGHITYRYTTGTWGVRLDELQRIKDILSLPLHRELLPMKSPYKVYDLDCTITGYDVSAMSLWVEVTPVNPEINKFKVDFSWSELQKSECPIYQKLTQEVQ